MPPPKKTESISRTTFPNLVTMLHLLLLTPVTSASVERANLALIFVKSDRRNRMGEARCGKSLGEARRLTSLGEGRLNALPLQGHQHRSRKGCKYLCEEEPTTPSSGDSCLTKLIGLQICNKWNLLHGLASPYFPMSCSQMK